MALKIFAAQSKYQIKGLLQKNFVRTTMKMFEFDVCTYCFVLV